MDVESEYISCCAVIGYSGLCRFLQAGVLLTKCATPATEVIMFSDPALILEKK